MEKKDDSYQFLIAEHVALAKDLCLPSSRRWNELFAILDGKDASGAGGWLSSLYERRLHKECNSSIEDFYLFLYDYLTRDNHYFLVGIIEKRTHFYSGYFKDILQGAFKAFKIKYREEWERVFLDDDRSRLNHGTLAARDSGSPIKEHAFNQLRQTLWKRNPKDCLIILLRLIYRMGNVYTAEALGMTSANTVSKRLERFNIKNYYSADGTIAAHELNLWLKHSVVLTFTPEDDPNKNISFVPWEVRIALPYDCSSPETKRCLIECTHQGQPIVTGHLHLGTSKIEIVDGRAQLTLKTLQESVHEREGCLALQIGDDRLTEGYPLVVSPENEPIKKIEDRTFIYWTEQPYSEAKVHAFLSDFGMGFAYLLNASLPFSSYGAPRKTAYTHLFPTPGEAWVVFASSEACREEGFLSKHGFIFPLEWRFHPEYAEPNSTLLPPSFVTLAKAITAQFDAFGWGLYPSMRFFHDQIDFSTLTLCGGEPSSLASAWLTLASALTLAQNNNYHPFVPIFASAQYNHETQLLAPIGSLDKKLDVAHTWGAKDFFVCQKQYAEHVQSSEQRPRLVPVYSHTPVACAQEVAYAFLKEFKPEHLSEMKDVHDAHYKVKRAELIKMLSSMANAIWDKGETKTSKHAPHSFIVLSGRPGIGKSLLLHDLVKRWRNHRVVSYVCHAGHPKSCLEFIHNVAYQLAILSSDFAQALLSMPKSIINKDVELTEVQARDLYKRWVVQPLRQSVTKNRRVRHYLVVDGLDEDDSGLITKLLCEDAFRLPENVSVVISTRPMEPFYSMLKRVATAEMDLSDQAYTDCCNRDLEKYIINLIYGNETIRQCWENAALPIDDDILRDKIASKDRSFLFARYVLQGIEDGYYHFDKLDQELPSGLIEFYDKSFRYRFKTSLAYDQVRPLLRLLLKTSRLSLADAQQALDAHGEHLPLGKMIFALRGYCLVEEGMLSLSDASLRDWLCDPIHNPEFSIF